MKGKKKFPMTSERSSKGKKFCRRYDLKYLVYFSTEKISFPHPFLSLAFVDQIKTERRRERNSLRFSSQYSQRFFFFVFNRFVPQHWPMLCDVRFEKIPLWYCRNFCLEKKEPLEEEIYLRQKQIDSKN